MATPDLSAFVAVLRGGDGQAVEALLSELDPILRSAIRLRLIDGQLRHVLDTTDILQSLLKDFLSRPMSGDRTPGGPGDLLAYLTAAVHHKIQTKARKERRRAGRLPDDWEPASPEPNGGMRQIDAQDLHQALRARLDAPNRLLLDLRAEELSWAEIAARVGGKPDTLRIRLRRAIAAALTSMDLEGQGHVR